jgi:hypothetical protein
MPTSWTTRTKPTTAWTGRTKPSPATSWSARTNLNPYYDAPTYYYDDSRLTYDQLTNPQWYPRTKP